MNVLLTGASHGIGRETARVLAAQGARLTLVARPSEALQEAAAEVGGHALAADVSQPADVERLFEHLSAPLDGVVHAAGIQGPVGPAWELSPAEWWETLQINLFGTYLVARAAARHFLAAGRPGRMVFFSGGGATGPRPDYTAYACSKVAVLRLAETMAVELAPHGVEVNCLAPGAVRTRMHVNPDPNTVWTSPRIGAEAAAWLVGPAAKGISGKLVAPLYDDYQRWKEHPITAEMFCLRRIVPRDRGEDWQ